MVEVADVVKTTEEEGVAIADEVIFWPGWLSMDTKTSRRLSVSLHMWDSTFVTSVEYWKLETSNTTTLPLISGDWDYALISKR